MQINVSNTLEFYDIVICKALSHHIRDVFKKRRKCMDFKPEKKLGFGLMRLPLTDPSDPSKIDIPQLEQMVDTFLDAGFTYCDTAWMYHDFMSEPTVGKAVVARCPRDRFTIASKMPVAMIHSHEEGVEIFEEQKEKLEIPAVAIECKTYLDKTMLEEVSTAGSQLLIINPNAKYYVVAERLKLTDAVNLKKYKVDQIFILRKMKNTDREFRLQDDYENNPIYTDVVENLFNYVRKHLTQEWKGSTSINLESGMLL